MSVTKEMYDMLTDEQKKKIQDHLFEKIKNEIEIIALTEDQKDELVQKIINDIDFDYHCGAEISEVISGFVTAKIKEALT